MSFKYVVKAAAGYRICSIGGDTEHPGAHITISDILCEIVVRSLVPAE